MLELSTFRRKILQLYFKRIFVFHLKELIFTQFGPNNNRSVCINLLLNWRGKQNYTVYVIPIQVIDIMYNITKTCLACHFLSNGQNESLFFYAVWFQKEWDICVDHNEIETCKFWNLNAKNNVVLSLHWKLFFIVKKKHQFLPTKEHRESFQWNYISTNCTF